MLQTIRNKSTSWFALAILFLALFSLTFFGIGDYLTRSTDTYVATVGDEKIEQSEFRQRWETWRQNVRQQLGDAYDPAIFEQPEYRRQLLDGMIDQALLRQSGERLNMVVAGSQLRAAITDEPAFQIDGRFDENTYRNVLAGARLTPTAYERLLRQDFAANLLPTALFETALVSEAEVDAYLRLSEQTRDFRLLRITEPESEVSDEVSEEELQAYYDEHSDRFMTPERVRLEYVELRAADLALDVEPSESELEQRYELEKARFGTPEERLASHILIRPDSDDADGQRAAIARAEELVAQVREDSERFEALAREHSADLASSEQGGDLGWLQRGMTDPAFEDALFELEDGAISDPVRSDDGYHIIWLRELRAGEQQSFDEVREILVTESLETERERAYSDRSGRLVDLSYEEPGSLQPVADAMGLEIREAGPFTRTSFDGLFMHAPVRQAAFSDEVLREGNNSDALSIGDNHIVVIRVSDHEQPAPRPLAEVADEIRGLVLDQRRAEAVRAHAQAQFERLESGETLDAIAESLELEVEDAEVTTRRAMVPEPMVVAEAFRMPRPSEGAPVRRLIDLGNGHALVELTAVQDGNPETVDASRREQVRTELRESHARAERGGLIEGLRERGKIVVADQRM